MATYEEAKGFFIQQLSSDPSNPVEGQIWYNTTTGVLKYRTSSATKTPEKVISLVSVVINSILNSLYEGMRILISVK